MKANLFTIYNQRLAGYLMLNGLPLVKLQANPQSNKNCFIFANTNILHDYMDKWQITKLSKKNIGE